VSRPQRLHRRQPGCTPHRLPDLALTAACMRPPSTCARLRSATAAGSNSSASGAAAESRGKRGLAVDQQRARDAAQPNGIPPRLHIRPYATTDPRPALPAAAPRRTPPIAHSCRGMNPPQSCIVNFVSSRVGIAVPSRPRPHRHRRPAPASRHACTHTPTLSTPAKCLQTSGSSASVKPQLKFNTKTFVISFFFVSKQPGCLAAN